MEKTILYGMIVALAGTAGYVVHTLYTLIANDLGTVNAFIASTL